MPVTTSPDNAVRLFTIKEAAEVLRIPISWLYERTRRNAIPYRRIGKYVRFTQDDLKEIISVRRTVEEADGQRGLRIVFMARQRGAIIRRGTTFSVKYRTPAGKQKWESGFANRSQAQQRLNQVLGEITHGSYVEPKATKFEKFAKEWLEGRVAVRGSTLSSYGSIVRKRLIPYFGKMSLSEIGYDQVQSFVHELAKEVSVKTLHNIVVCLRVMLVGKRGGSALKRGFLRHDPTRGVEMPAMDQKQIVPPTRDEVWKLVDAAEELGWLRTRNGSSWTRSLGFAGTRSSLFNTRTSIGPIKRSSSTRRFRRQRCPAESASGNGGSARRSRENRTAGSPPRMQSWNCCGTSVPRQRTLPG